MRILIINVTCGFGSTGRICTDIADELIEQNHDVMIAYGRGNVPNRFSSRSIRIGSQFRTRVNALMCRLFDNDGFASKKQTRKFLKWAETYNPDIVWLHNLHGYYINVPLLFNWLKGRASTQIKWTLHDCWAFTGHCCYFDFVGCKKWTNGCYECPAKREYPKSILADCSRENYLKKKGAFTGLKNMTIITPSFWLAGLVKQSFLKEYDVTVVNNKIDRSIFKPTANDFRRVYGLEDKKIVLGVASPWSERKGLKDFVLLSAMLDNTYSIVLVGLSKKQIKELPNSILGFERTNSLIELAKIYSSADVFVNTTYEDNYPTVNLESQACGTPCITYDTGGSIESVPPQNVVEKGNIQMLALRIKEICEAKKYD